MSNERSDEKVIEAKVNGEILYPLGSRVTLEEDTTDNNGQISYSWKMNDNTELGRFAIEEIISSYYPMVDNINSKLEQIEDQCNTERAAHKVATLRHAFD